MTKTLTDDQKALLDEVFDLLDVFFADGINIQEKPEESKLEPNIGLGMQFSAFMVKRELMKRYGIK